MEIQIGQIIISLINFLIIVGIIFVIVKAFKYVMYIAESNKRMEKKIDRILETLDRKEM